MIGGQLDLFAQIKPGLLISPCDPDGSVCSDDEIVETINLTDKRVTIRIELARDGNYWMFSTSLNHPNGGGGYRVGRKWGKRANNRGDALCFAFEELLNRADIYPNVKKQVSQLLAKLPESYLLEILV